MIRTSLSFEKKNFLSLKKIPTSKHWLELSRVCGNFTLHRLVLLATNLTDIVFDLFKLCFFLYIYICIYQQQGFDLAMFNLESFQSD